MLQVQDFFLTCAGITKLWLREAKPPEKYAHVQQRRSHIGTSATNDWACPDHATCNKTLKTITPKVSHRGMLTTGQRLVTLAPC